MELEDPLSFHIARWDENLLIISDRSKSCIYWALRKLTTEPRAIQVIKLLTYTKSGIFLLVWGWMNRKTKQHKAIENIIINWKKEYCLDDQGEQQIYKNILLWESEVDSLYLRVFKKI